MCSGQILADTSGGRGNPDSSALIGVISDSELKSEASDQSLRVRRSHPASRAIIIFGLIAIYFCRDNNRGTSKRLESGTGFQFLKMCFVITMNKPFFEQ